jgi:predicted RNA-binding Zn-ribbon protein involved in translation (DUF1610 family)
MKAERKCGDCGETLAEIRLIDKGHFSAHTDVEYAPAEAKRGIWTGQFPIEGKVAAFMCPECGRITHFAVPKSKQ